MDNVLILIPARYDSSRFPGKPLTKIHGKSMIQRVYENMQGSGFHVCVVTDHQEIEDHVKTFGTVVRVDDDVPSGSERIYLAYERFYKDKQLDLIINVQGDEPLLHADEVKKLAKYHMDENVDVATMVKKRELGDEDFSNPNIVKALFVPTNGRCLYFSRSSIPFDRAEQGGHWYQHIGVYSYRPDALQSFHDSEMGIYENLEKLEQLRLLENKKTIGAVETEFRLIGVDTPDDVAKVEEFIRE